MGEKVSRKREFVRVLLGIGLAFIVLFTIMAVVGMLHQRSHRAYSESGEYSRVMYEGYRSVDEIQDLYGGLPTYLKPIGDWVLIGYEWENDEQRGDRTASAEADFFEFGLGASVFLADEKGNVVAKWYNNGDLRHHSKFDEELSFAELAPEDIERLIEFLPSEEEDVVLIGPPLEFSMEDQDQNAHTEEDFLGAPLLIMSSDKAGSEHSKTWSRAIFEDLDERGVERIRIVPVPQLGMAPAAARGMVRNMVKKDLGEMFALLDWESEFTQKYQFKESHANYLLFDADGVLLRKEHVQELDEALLGEIVDSIAEVMNAHQESIADEATAAEN